MKKPNHRPHLPLPQTRATIALTITTLTTLTLTQPPTTNPNNQWCQTLHNTGSTLSCDWANPQTPTLAKQLAKKHHLTPHQATIQAAKQTEK